MDLMEMHLNLRAKNEKENIASGLVKTTLANAFEDLSTWLLKGRGKCIFQLLKNSNSIFGKHVDW